MGTASANSGPDVVDMNQAPGSTVDPRLSSSGVASLGGSVEWSATRATVAIQDVATGHWWQPDDTCESRFHPTCEQGTFGVRWEKNDAELGLQNPGETRWFSFGADLPDGTYNLGVKAYDAAGATGRSVWQQIHVERSEEPPPPPPEPIYIDAHEPRAGQVFNEGLIVMNGGFSQPSHTVVAMYNRDIKKWVDPNGDALAAWKAFPVEVTAVGPDSWVWTHDVRLPPGRYAFGADAIDYLDRKVGSTPWTYFEVKSCSVRCANLSLSTLDDGRIFVDNEVCFSATSDAYTKGGSVKLAVRNATTGEWLKGYPLEFSPGWAQFDNLGSHRAEGLESRSSCFYQAPLNFAAGTYNLGVKAYDADGVLGPKTWTTFTVTN